MLICIINKNLKIYTMVEYKFILEVARHGARAPTVLYDLVAEGQANFPEPMELTKLGANQHFKTG